jgi:hypothetical protein
MPEQNNPIQGNFGGIFQANTPVLDRVTQQLQQNYADRKAFLQKESQNTDELLNKELNNVRSVDTPDIIDAYNDYKNSKQNQLFNKGLQQNPKAYAAAQMDANAKYANLMGMINKSSQYNAFGKQLAANRLQKPDNYGDDTGDKLSTFYNTKMGDLANATYNGKPTDLTNVDNYRYQGGNFDFSKLHKTAVGNENIHYDDGTTDASGVQTTQHGIKYGSTPGAYRNTYVGGLAGAEASRAARYSWSQHSANQQDLDQLDAAYQNSPNWQKLGIPTQTLPPYNPADPVGNEATYQAKQYLVSMNPADVPAKTTVDRGALSNLTSKNRLNSQEIMEAIKEGNREKLAGIKHTYKQSDAAEQSQILDQTVGTMLDDATKSSQSTYTSVNGKVSKRYEIKASPELKLALPTVDAKGHKFPADAIQFDPQNNTVVPIYYKRDADGNIAKSGNTYAVDPELSKPITMPEFKAIVGKAYFGTREAAKETAKPAGASAKTGGSGISWQ